MNGDIALSNFTTILFDQEQFDSHSRHLKLSCFLFLTLFLQGCYGPRINYYLDSVQETKTLLQGKIRYIIVKPLGKIERYLESEIFLYWQNSLQDALKRSKSFTEEGDQGYDLDVSVIEIKHVSGLPTITAVRAEYILSNKATGALIWKTTIASEGRVEFSEWSNGNYRLQLAPSRAIKNNIEYYLSYIRNLKPIIGNGI